MQFHIFGKKCTSHKNEGLNTDNKKCEQGRKNKTTGPQPSKVMPITR